MNDIHEYDSNSGEESSWMKPQAGKDPRQNSTRTPNSIEKNKMDQDRQRRSYSRSSSKSPSRSPFGEKAKSNSVSPRRGSTDKDDRLKELSEKKYSEARLVGRRDRDKKSRDSSTERHRRRSRSGSKERRRKSRSLSKEKKRRSRSGSRDRRHRRASRSSRSRSKERRLSRRSSSRERRRRSRSRSPSKGKRRYGRGSSRERRRRRSRSDSRSPRRSRSPGDRNYHKRSRSRSPRSYRRRYPPGKAGSFSPERRKTICRAVLPPSFGKDKDRVPTTEEVEAKLKAHMEKMKEKASEDAKNVNLPSYLNPAMVNVQQFKQQQEKRKLLWSGKKTKEETVTNETPEASWGGSAFQDDETEAKFRRLMGIKGAQSASAGNQAEKSRKVLEDLEREYERSRAFQLSRGAGGTTGIGLGFNQGP